MHTTWDDVIRYLVAVRIGQELGTDSELAQTIAHTIDAVVRIATSFLS